jgi:Zn-dependent peptidase ImmA (M78 family)
MKLRRGFRTEAEQYAEEFRTELGLAIDGPLDPFQLAAHLGIPVVPLSELPDLDPACLRFFLGDWQSMFSATTVVDGTYKMIIHNDAHHPYRRHSNVMHEIAHILLGHPPRPPLMHDGCRHFDANNENEANELGFTLLIPRHAALRIIEQRIDFRRASINYGVSKQLLEYRIRITNANSWAANRKRFRSAAE